MVAVVFFPWGASERYCILWLQRRYRWPLHSVLCHRSPPAIPYAIIYDHTYDRPSLP